jgi:hypothetical protein
MVVGGDGLRSDTVWVSASKGAGPGETRTGLVHKVLAGARQFCARSFRGAPGLLHLLVLLRTLSLSIADFGTGPEARRHPVGLPVCRREFAQHLDPEQRVPRLASLEDFSYYVGLPT